MQTKDDFSIQIFLALKLAAIKQNTKQTENSLKFRIFQQLFSLSPAMIWFILDMRML